MKKQISQIFSDKIIRMSSLLTAALLIILLGITTYFFFKLPPFIPLYNQLPWGLERLSDKIGIFISLILSISFFILNIILAGLTYEKMPLVSRILSITSLLIALLTFIFVTRTVQLVL